MPATSVIASSGPGSSAPMRIPRSLARTPASKLDRMAQTESRQQLWGGETTKAMANFQVSGEPIPSPVARWLGRIKAAAARVTAELGLLDDEKAQRSGAAADGVA